MFPEPQTGQRFFILWLLCKITTQDREKRPPCSQQLHCTRPRDREASRQRHIVHTNSTKRRPQSDNRSLQQQSSNLVWHTIIWAATASAPKQLQKRNRIPKNKKKFCKHQFLFFFSTKDTTKNLQKFCKILLQYFCNIAAKKLLLSTPHLWL